jgi:hypothetical protein
LCQKRLSEIIREPFLFLVDGKVNISIPGNYAGKHTYAAEQPR